MSDTDLYIPTDLTAGLPPKSLSTGDGNVALSVFYPLVGMYNTWYVNFKRLFLPAPNIAGFQHNVWDTCISVKCAPRAMTLPFKINLAIEQLAAPGGVPEAIRTLELFQQDTRQFVREGLLPISVGDRFITEAQAIIEAIRGRVPINPASGPLPVR